MNIHSVVFDFNVVDRVNVDGTGVSAVKVMEEARSRNIPILDITIDNYAEMNSILSAPASVRLDIYNTINENTVISIPSRQIDYYGWSGTGYIVSDTATGASAYRLCGSLSDSMSGGATAIKVGVGVIAALDIVLSLMDLMMLLQVMMPASGLVSFAVVPLPAVTAVVLLTLGCMSLTYSLVNYYHYLDTGDEQYAYNMLFSLIPNVAVFGAVKFLVKFGPSIISVFSNVSGFLGQGANSLILKYGDEFAEMVVRRGKAAIDYIDGCEIGVVNSVKGYGIDGINALLKYKADLIAILGSFSDNADDVVGFVIKFGDEAVDAMKNGISPGLISSLDDLGISPARYIEYNIVSQEIANNWATALEMGNSFKYVTNQNDALDLTDEVSLSGLNDYALSRIFSNIDDSAMSIADKVTLKANQFRKALFEGVESELLVVADASNVDEFGNIKWPTNPPEGFTIFNPPSTTLEVGTIIDRYGNPYGSFTSPLGTPYVERSLPYIENPGSYHKYKVIKPIEGVKYGEIAQAFNQNGGGIQFKLPDIIDNLLGEYLEEIY